MPKSTVFPRSVELSLDQARRIVRGALEASRRRRLMPLTVVVLDGGGQLVCMEREDGSGLLRFSVAYGKAYGALGLGISSRTIGQRNEGRDAFLAAVAGASEGRFVPVAGAVLILNERNETIGAVGASGDTSDEDEACVVAGIEAAGLRVGLDTDEG